MNLLSFLPPGIKVALAVLLGTAGIGGSVAVATFAANHSTTTLVAPLTSSSTSTTTSPSVSPTNHGQTVKKAVIACRAEFPAPGASASSAGTQSPEVGQPTSSPESGSSHGKGNSRDSFGKCVEAVAKDNHGHNLPREAPSAEVSAHAKGDKSGRGKG